LSLSCFLRRRTTTKTISAKSATAAIPRTGPIIAALGVGEDAEESRIGSDAVGMLAAVGLEMKVGLEMMVGLEITVGVLVVLRCPVLVWMEFVSWLIVVGRVNNGGGRSDVAWGRPGGGARGRRKLTDDPLR